MAWTTPTTRVTGELITAAIWNTDIVDNLTYLLAPPATTSRLNEGANYTVNSGTFANLDATDLSITQASKSGRVLLHFECSFDEASGTTSTLYLDFAVDTVRVGGDDGIAFATARDSYLNGNTLAIDWLVTGLSVGDHTFTVQAKRGGGTITIYVGAGTSARDVHPQFYALEV